MPLRLLVVDDDAVDRQAVRRSLRSAALEADVLEAASAEEALALVDAQAPDLVLLDYQLPGTDGLAVLGALRARGITVPVVALTGRVDQQTAVSMMKAGAADYLNKDSLTPEILERSVRHALQVAAGERERQALLAREQAAREEAQAANRAKDEFLATLSHELRTPLNSILGWTRLLTAGALDAAASRRALETIERNVRLQAKLIDDLLDISRVVTGKLTLERQPVSLAAIVGEAVESHRPAAMAAGISLRYTVPEREQAVFGDQARLQQVVTNLLSNALKFTAERGAVDVTLEFDADEARLTIADDGIGIPAEFLPHVFEQFRQADATTVRRQGGLGLGLAIVRRIVELHGGTVTAHSDGPGSGSSFRVTVPTVPLALGPRPEDPSEDPRLDGVSVLVVDDDEDGRTLMVTVLEGRGARVRAAANSREALHMVEESLPDVVLSDISMPGEDGYQLLEQLRMRGRITPAAAITACASPEDRARAAEAGFSLHLAKPVEPAQLVRAVHVLLHDASAAAAGAAPVPPDDPA